LQFFDLARIGTCQYQFIISAQCFSLWVSGSIVANSLQV
jgi:hypothetical protein